MFEEPDGDFVIRGSAGGHHDTWLWMPADHYDAGRWGNVPLASDAAWDQVHQVDGVTPDPATGVVSIEVYDLDGEKVEDMTLETSPGGTVVYQDANGYPGEALIYGLPPGEVEVVATNDLASGSVTVTAFPDAVSGHVIVTTDPPVALASSCGTPQLLPDLDDGDEAMVVNAIRGTWHLELGAAVSGFGELVEVHATVTRVSDGLVLAGDQQPKRFGLAAADACAGSFEGYEALLDDATPDVPYDEFICGLDGEVLRVELDVVDVEDPTRVATASVEVVAASDPMDDCARMGG